jgi:hypothetical protein
MEVVYRTPSYHNVFASTRFWMPTQRRELTVSVAFIMVGHGGSDGRSIP